MVSDALTSPVVVDGILTDEKLADLFARKTEYPELDYKATIDLDVLADTVELAKDVGAMQVRGGYVLIGVNNEGTLTGQLDSADLRPFDEARLRPKLLKWLPQPLELRTRIAKRDGHVVVVIFVGRHPSGCAFFHTTGEYERKGKQVVAFRPGDVFWRDGTQSIRLSQQGFHELIARRIADEKSGWLDEQREIRGHERADLETAYQSRTLTEQPLGSVNFDLDDEALTLAVLELLRKGDTTALRYLLNSAYGRARSCLEHNDVDASLADLLDKLVCLAATFLEYDEFWFSEVVGRFAQIYSMPLGDGDDERYGYAVHIDPGDPAPRIWLLIIERVFGLGALAVRRANWTAVRTLTIQHPKRLSGYHPNWLRHALTMASRAQHLQEQRDGQTVELSLLSLARNEVARLDSLRSDGLKPDADEIITSLAQFDVLSNIAAIDAAGTADTRVFYTNFARFRQTRIQPIVEQLLSDDAMRKTLFTQDDSALAIALATIGERARAEGFRFDGFESWHGTPVASFIGDATPQIERA